LAAGEAAGLAGAVVGLVVGVACAPPQAVNTTEPARANPMAIRLYRVTFMNPYFLKAHIVKMIVRLLNNLSIVTDEIKTSKQAAVIHLYMIHL
jgi:hypothetical protein